MHPTKPNILVVLTDQHRFDTIAAAVDHFGVTTPALDELTRTGVSFDAAYTTSPVCCPARSSIVTGLYPSQTGVYGNLDREVGPMAEGIVTVANRMHEAGYQTVYHGKSHLGGRLENYGFEIAFENSHDPSTVTEACRFWRNADWIFNKRPFFHVVSLLNPHDIYFLRPGMEMEPTLERWPNQDDDLAGKPWPQTNRRQIGWSDARWEYYRRFYASKVSKVDAQIDELLDELICSGFGPNTWIFFTADHGDMCGEHGLSFKGPFMYEGVTHVPLIIVPPRRGWAGAGNIDGDRDAFRPFRTSALVSHVDLVPTIMDIAGLAANATLPGTSLLPIIRGEQDEVRDHVIAEWHCMGRLVTPIRMVRTKRHKYNLYLGIGEELYDLDADGAELTNRADDPALAAVKADLRGRLETHLEQTGDPFFTRPVSQRPPGHRAGR